MIEKFCKLNENFEKRLNEAKKYGCWGYDSQDLDRINGKCQECGMPTYDGNSVISCDYSPVICEFCQDAECCGDC